MDNKKFDLSWKFIFDFWAEELIKEKNKITKKSFPKKFPLEYPPDPDYPLEKERKIKITYFSIEDEPNTYEIIKFPIDTTDSEINSYCLDTVEVEYGNMRWFKWKEIF